METRPNGAMIRRPFSIFAFGCLFAAVLTAASGCSVRSYAVDSIGDMLADGDSVFARDDDLKLVGEALPFSLKLVESLLAESPRHRGLLLTAARGYVLYAYAYVHFESERIASRDLQQAIELRERARRLYLRAFDYAMSGLEVREPGFSEALAAGPVGAVAQVEATEDRQNVALLYWSASALGLAISTAKHDPVLLARLPEVEALLQRALALDESWDRGSLHELAIAWAAAKPGTADREAIDEHYARGLALSQGRRAGLHVAYAEAVAVPAQDREMFRALMERALSVDLDAQPDQRLQNAIAQRRARWLVGRIDELFLDE